MQDGVTLDSQRHGRDRFSRLRWFVGHEFFGCPVQAPLERGIYLLLDLKDCTSKIERECRASSNKNPRLTDGGSLVIQNNTSLHAASAYLTSASQRWLRP